MFSRSVALSSRLLTRAAPLSAPFAAPSAPLAATLSSVAKAPPAPRSFDVNANVMYDPIFGPAAKLFAHKPGKEDEPEQSKSELVWPSLAASPLVVSAASTKEFVPWFAADSTTKMLLENCVSVKGISLGLPGLAAQVCFMAPMTAMKQIKEDGTHGDLPLIPYSAMCASGFLWLQYGLLLDNSAIWAPNVPAFVLGGLYTAYYCSTPGSTSSTMKAVHFAGIGAWCAGVMGVATQLPQDVAVNYLGYIGVGAVIVMFGGPLAAIKTVVAEKSTASIPFPFAVATWVNCVLWSVYGLGVLDDWFIYFPNLLGLASATLQLSLFAKYGFGK